jgi:hypothetical protein
MVEIRQSKGCNGQPKIFNPQINGKFWWIRFSVNWGYSHSFHLRGISLNIVSLWIMILYRKMYRIIKDFS